MLSVLEALGSLKNERSKDKYIEEKYQLFVFASKTMFTFLLEASKRSWIEDISNKLNNPISVCSNRKEPTRLHPIPD